VPDGIVTVPPRVGDVAKTSAPEPVSSVTAAARLALDEVARNVAIPVARPLMPEETGSPVQFVNTPDAGVPSAGAVRMGDVSVLLVSVSVPAKEASVWLVAGRVRIVFAWA
jgi:hypothetical protein